MVVDIEVHEVQRRANPGLASVAQHHSSLRRDVFVKPGRQLAAVGDLGSMGLGQWLMRMVYGVRCELKLNLMNHCTT